MPYRAKIKALRESVGMTQRELAQAIGMNASQLSLIEAGKRDLRVGQLLLIAAALGISVAQLINGVAPAVFALRHNDLVMVRTEEGPKPYAVAESRGGPSCCRSSTGSRSIRLTATSSASSGAEPRASSWRNDLTSLQIANYRFPSPGGNDDERVVTAA